MMNLRMLNRVYLVTVLISLLLWVPYSPLYNWPWNHVVFISSYVAFSLGLIVGGIILILFEYASRNKSVILSLALVGAFFQLHMVIMNIKSKDMVSKYIEKKKMCFDGRLFSHNEALSYECGLYEKESLIAVVGSTNGPFCLKAGAIKVLEFPGQVFNYTMSGDSFITWEKPTDVAGEAVCYPFVNQNGDVLVIIKEVLE